MNDGNDEITITSVKRTRLICLHFNSFIFMMMRSDFLTMYLLTKSYSKYNAAADTLTLMQI